MARCFYTWPVFLIQQSIPGNLWKTFPVMGNLIPGEKSGVFVVFVFAFIFGKTIQMFPQLPTLGKVPNITHDLVLKTSPNGIIFLKNSKFKSRYTGNKYSTVDINGKLWLKRSDYEKSLRAAGDEKTKKRKPAKNSGLKQIHAVSSTDEVQISDNLLTPPENFSTKNPGLPTKQKTYSVNGSQVRQRLLSFINTQAGKKELYFWTVTFPMGLPDAAAYKVYNVWLTTLRQYKMLKDYLWVAERQENGTIHFHIAIPHKMSVKRANAMMRGTLINAARRGDIDCNIYALRKYNGVDIAKNRKTKRVTNFAIKKGSRSLANYLSKYVTKNNGQFTHLAWHNSRGYSGLFLGVTFTLNEFVSQGYNEFLDKTKRLNTPHFIFVPWQNGPPGRITEHLFLLNSFLQHQLN